MHAHTRTHAYNANAHTYIRTHIAYTEHSTNEIHTHTLTHARAHTLSDMHEHAHT